MSRVSRSPRVSLPLTLVSEPPRRRKFNVGEEASPVKTLLYGGEQSRRKKLYSYSTKEVADEMTLLDAGLLRLIKVSELEQGAWMKKDKNQRAPNIMAMVKSFNNVALLVPTEILEEETPQARAKVVIAYIKIAQMCHCHGNYNSLKAILAGLQCTPIFRLSRTWKEVGARKRRKFQELTTLMHENNNWSAYRQEIAKKLQENTHFVPFLGIFLTTMAFLQAAEATFDSRVDSSKNKVSSEAVNEANKRRMSTASMYTTYHLLEPITVRETLERLRKNSVTLNTELPSARHTSRYENGRQDLHHRCSSPVQINGATPTDEVVTCRSCEKEDMSSTRVCQVTSSGGIESPCARGTHERSTSDLGHVEAVREVKRVPSPHMKFQYSASEGNVLGYKMQTSGNPVRSPGSGSFSTDYISRRNSYECALNLNCDSPDECDINGDIEYFPSDNMNSREQAVTMADRETTPTKMLEKKMRIPRGLSKPAKFFAMLKGRYRNTVSSPTIGSVGEGTGDLCASDSGKHLILLNGTYDQDSEKTTDILSGDEETTSLIVTDEKDVCTISHGNLEEDELQDCTKKISNEDSGTDLAPGGLQKGRILGGSLEAFLGAANAELPSTKGRKSRMGWRTGGRGEDGRPIMMRSPSLFCLKSFDVGDGDMGSCISLTASFSSPSLDSFLDLGVPEAEVPSNSTSVYNQPSELSLSAHPPSEDIERAEACVLENAGPSGTCVLESNKPEGMFDSPGMRGKGGAKRIHLGRCGLDKEMQSRSPSNSSEESTDGCQPRPALLKQLTAHRRNSSDPNLFLNNKSKKMSKDGKTMHNSPRPNKSFTSKHSSPLIDAFKHTSPEKRLSSTSRRYRVNLDSCNRWAIKREHLMSSEELLHQYQFSSLGCCYLINSRQSIRELLTIYQHNTEAVNYKLSYSREPA